jgi:hypothetical protein
VVGDKELETRVRDEVEAAAYWTAGRRAQLWRS